MKKHLKDIYTFLIQRYLLNLYTYFLLLVTTDFFVGGLATFLTIVRVQMGMSAVPCGIRGDFVNSMVLGYLEHGDSKNLVRLSENPGDPRKSGPEPWRLKVDPVGGAKNKMYVK